MNRVLSTYRYVNQTLSPGLLAEIAEAGIRTLEIFAAPSHFNYRAPSVVRDIAAGLADRQMELHALHAPTERNQAVTRDSGVPMSISETERVRRIEAVDEVKRALEVAEQIPFRYLIQHMGQSHDSADPRRLDAAFNSLEHLVIFAKHRGVTITLENTPNELGSPLTLQKFIADTHLSDLRLCFDIGHAHMEDGVAASFEAMRPLIVTAHLHDNHGEKDEHLLPYDGSIDWGFALELLATVPSGTGSQAPPLVLELKEQAPGTPSLDQIRASFDRIEKELEEKSGSAVQP